MRVLITDYAWPTLDVERAILDPLGVELVVAETGAEDELVALAPGVVAILTCWKQVTAAVLDAADACRLVCRYGVGLDNIDVGRATELGMIVARVPDYCVEEVADHTIALLLAAARGVAGLDRLVRAGVWDNKAAGPLPRLRGSVLALVGFGAVGRAVAERAACFGMDVRPWTRGADLDGLLAEADFVSLHVALNDETRHLIDERRLRLMKPTAWLINTARGAVVDEDALARAVAEGWIAGAALDVLTTEPAPPGHPLIGLDNVIVTPHAAFYSEASIAELARKSALNVAAVLTGGLPPAPYIANPTVLDQSNLRTAV